MSDEKLETIVSEYVELAKDKNVDTAALLMNALQQEEDNKLSLKQKRWGYLVSLGLPPLGLLFALAFYFSDKSDGKQTAYICIGLTVASIVVSIVLFKSLFSGTGASIQQIQQIKPQDVYELTK